MTNPLDWLSDAVTDRQRSGLWRSRETHTPRGSGQCERNGQLLRNFADNDYLGLAGDPRVIAAASTVLQEVGVGARASALVTGRTHWHAELESALANFEGEPSVLVFPTGYAANVGTLTSLMGDADLVCCDRLNHASLVAGCRLSGARLRVYRHTQLDRLQRELAQASGYRRRFIVTDAIFSMDGDAAPLPDLCDLAERYDSAVVVDEAHSTGVLGTHGRGLCEHQGVEYRVAVRVGTLSKAVGTLGGFVAGSETLCDHLWNSAGTHMFSTALPPAICAAATTAIHIIQQEPDRRRRVLENATLLRTLLENDGIAVCPNGIAAIVPVIVGDPHRMMTIVDDLREQGFLVGAIRPPTVPRNTARLRMTVSAQHSADEITALAQAVVTSVSRITAMAASHAGDDDGRDRRSRAGGFEDWSGCGDDVHGFENPR